MPAQPTRESPRRPDFVIIGAMKSGTSTLDSYLRRHPDVFMSYPKEPKFFSRDEVRAQGLDWYFSLFLGAHAGQICGEASTCYSRWPYFGNVAGRIHEVLPDARFIYVMRHPVERAYSHYRHEIEERRMLDERYTISFEKALEEEPVIIDTSLYRRQIEKFLDYYPREKVLLLFFEDLTNDPPMVLSQVETFLGIRHYPELTQSEIVSNRFGSRIAQEDLVRLEDRLRRFPGLARAVKALLPLPARERMREIATAVLARRRRIQEIGGRISPLLDTTRRQLLTRFVEPNRALEELMGRRVPASWHR